MKTQIRVPISVCTVNFDNNQHGPNENVRIGNLFRMIVTAATLIAMQLGSGTLTDSQAVKNREELIRCYDEVAEEYGRTYCRELDGKPLDRELLRRFAASISAGQRVCDLGCGPGHVANHLKSLGLEVMGLDVSPGMIAVARRLYPSIDFRVGDMLRLDLGAASLGGIAAFYSIIHLSRESIAEAFAEMSRVLMPAGRVLVAFHRGRGTYHEDESFGKPVPFDCTLFEPEEVASAMEKAGLVVEDVAVRNPYDFEFPMVRVYISAKSEPVLPGYL